MVEEIRKLAPDAKFAVTTFSDYPKVSNNNNGIKYGEDGDYPWKVNLDFSSNIPQIKETILNIDVLGGGDQPEAYLRALSELTTLSWSLETISPTSQTQVAMLHCKPTMT
jgi:hypothetical protein